MALGHDLTLRNADLNPILGLDRMPSTPQTRWDKPLKPMNTMGRRRAVSRAIWGKKENKPRRTRRARRERGHLRSQQARLPLHAPCSLCPSGCFSGCCNHGDHGGSRSSSHFRKGDFPFMPRAPGVPVVVSPDGLTTGITGDTGDRRQLRCQQAGLPLHAPCSPCAPWLFFRML